jgi:hypothetical protein
MTGIAVYASEDRMLFATAVNATRSDGFVFVGSK